MHRVTVSDFSHDCCVCCTDWMTVWQHMY